MMGTEGFDADRFSKEVRNITVLDGGDLEFHFYGDEKKLWKQPPKKPKKQKQPAMIRPKRCMDGKIFCGLCGRRYGRQKSDRAEGGIIWRCRSKTSGGVNCENVNYLDREFREIFCHVMGKKEFSEEYFDKVVEKIIVGKNGNLDFHLKDGSVKHHETLKLLANRYENTNTPIFEEKLVCGCCGNRFMKQGTERYSYWSCLGKHRVRTECTSAHYTDCNLRLISVWIMGTEEFDEDAFAEAIDSITALPGGGLEYTFKDGRKKTWHDGL